MTKPLGVLILEDRQSDAELMVYELEQAGFALDWQRVDTEADYLAQLQRGPDVILADHSLPQFGAPQALEVLKESGLDIPFIVVTGTISEEVAVERMKQGATDYILKDRMARLGQAIIRALEEKKLREEKRKADEALRARAQQLEVLHEISQTILTSPDLGTTLERILNRVVSLGPFDLGTVLLGDPESGRVKPAASYGYQDAENVPREPSVEKSGRSRFRALMSRKPAIVENVPEAEGVRSLKNEGIQSAIIVPVRTEHEILGSLLLGSRRPRKFPPNEVSPLEIIGNQMGIAIQKARLYSELKQRLLELERANKVKDQFLSVMSYELRTPLNVVVGYASLLKDGMLGEVNPRQKEALGQVLNKANDQLNCISSILYTSDLEAGSTELKTGEVNLVDLLDNLRSGYDLALYKELSLIWDFPSTLPSIRTDGAKLKNILQSLIANALKVTEKGHVTVSVRYISEVKRVVFQVEDTGIGIPREALPHIFEKFRPLDSSETRLYGGVGLGLYMAKKFTDLLGGTISVESQSAKGSRFTVTIPVT